MQLSLARHRDVEGKGTFTGAMMGCYEHDLNGDSPGNDSSTMSTRKRRRAVAVIPVASVWMERGWTGIRMCCGFVFG